jgi:hypothetical protein
MNRKTRRGAESRLQREDARGAAAFAATPVGAAMKAVLDSLTTPDKEDWTILVDDEDLRLFCVREDAGKAEGMYVRTTVAGFKAGGSKGSIDTAPLDGLGCVTFILPADAEERGALDVDAGHRAQAGLQASFDHRHRSHPRSRASLGRDGAAPSAISRRSVTDRGSPGRRSPAPEEGHLCRRGSRLRTMSRIKTIC